MRHGAEGGEQVRVGSIGQRVGSGAGMRMERMAGLEGVEKHIGEASAVRHSLKIFKV